MLFVSAITAAVLGRVPTVERASVEDLLVRRLQQGDARALGDAYDAHHEAVRAFGRRLLGDDAAAEDLVHDVFVSLPGVIRRFEGRSALRTFLLSIAVNHARHARRSIARRLGAYERLHEELPYSVTVETEGPDETEALEAVIALMATDLGGNP